MSPKLPVVSGKQAIKVMEKIGYQVVRQKGSHIRLRNYQDQNCKPITIPNHKELKPGLLQAILRDANLTIEKFSRLL